MANSIDRIAAIKNIYLASATRVMFQLVDNQQVHPIDSSNRIELQVIAPCRSI